MSIVLSYSRRQARNLLTWLRARPAPSGTSMVMAWTGLVLGLLAADAVLLPIGPVPILVILLLFVCFGPGAALVCQVRLGDPVAAWALVLVLSLSTFAVAAGLMVWLRIWHPTAGVVVLGLVTAVLSAAELAPLTDARNRRTRTVAPPARPSPTPGPRVPAQRIAPAAEKLSPSGARPSGQPSPAVPNASGPVKPAKRVLPMPRPRSSPEVTAVIPKVVDDPASTTVIPKVVDDPASTTVIPKVVDDPASTTVIPKVVDDPASTTVIPKVVDDPASTAVIPRIVEDPDRATRDSAAGEDTAAGATPDQDATAPGGWRRYARLLGDLAPMAAVVVLWLFAIAHTSTAHVTSYGLLFVMHPTFFVAVGVCAAGFLVELSRTQWRGWVLVAYLVLLVLLMHATVPLLDAEPEYPWVYTHLGVVDFIRVHGEVTDSSDIYQQWPTFFAAVAQLIAASGINPLPIGAWAPPFFDLATCLPVFAIARTLTNDRRVPYLTVFLFTAINWIGQDYLSPQAFAYLLSIGALMILLRWLRRTVKPKRVRWRLLHRLQSWVQAGLPETPYTSARTERASLIALYVVYGTVVISHQISPYIVAASATALAVLGLIQPWRVVPILMGIAVAYAAPRYTLVDSYGIFNGFNFLHNASGNHAGQVEAAGVFSHKVVMSLALSVWGSVGVILLAARRRLGPLAVPGALAFAPMAILAGQNYGGEAVYRVFLFSSPWCAYLIANAVLSLRLPERVRQIRLPWRWLRVAAATPVLAATVLAAMQGEHGQLVFEQVTPDEVNGALYFYQHVETGAMVMDALTNSADRLTARYADINDGHPADALLPSLDDGPVQVSAAIDAEDVDAINGYFDKFTQKPAEYLVVTSSMAHYADYFGYLPPGTLDRLNTALSASPRWTVWWASTHMRVYKFKPEPDSP